MKKFLNKKISIKSLLVLLLAIICVAGTLAATQVRINALLTPDVKITYNGVVQTPRDGNGNVVYPVNYNGYTYLPIRGLAGILGIDIDWDQNSKTVLLGSAPAAPAGQPGGGVIPAGGSQIRVNGESRYTLTPGQSGIWSFRTSDNGDFDPRLNLYDSSGKLIADDDDSNWELNALLFVRLNAGSVYTIETAFYGSAGSCILTAAPAKTLPAGGGTVIVEDITAFTFTPDKSGVWTFSTSNNGDSDPHLMICDANGNYIDEDDDGGDNLNALLTLSLNAGTTYILDADFYYSEIGSYELAVSYGTP